MMETGEDMESEVAEGTAMGTALKSSGEKVASSFNKKTKGLKVSYSSCLTALLISYVCTLGSSGPKCLKFVC